MDAFSRGQEFLSGVRDESPILLGVVPFGMIFGALAITSGLSTAAAQAMSSIIFAGSAQFIAAQLLGADASGIVILMVVFVINLRHLLYSASVASHVKSLRPRWKLMLAYLLTDEAYVVTITHYNSQGDARPALVLFRRGADLMDIVAAQHGRGHLHWRPDFPAPGRWGSFFPSRSSRLSFPPCGTGQASRRP